MALDRIEGKLGIDSRPPVRLDPKILAAIDENDERNEFSFDLSKQPADMTYEWKRLTYGGKEDLQYQSKLAQTGWVPVPASRHSEIGNEAGHEAYKIAPKGCIVIAGQILMERHVEYTNRAKAKIAAINNAQVGAQRERISQSDEAAMPRKVTAFKQTYEGQEIDA